MGVKGLWRLLLPIGRRISLETLEGQVLAIDASIWLTQFLKAIRDPNTGQSQPAAHLIGFIRRLCRLYFHGIRPVLVFDGATPEIKQRELQNRRKRREQFAHSVSDEGVQRLARRLLAQNLQKIKASPAEKLKEGRSGFAAGFNPGNQASTAAQQQSSTTSSRAKLKDPPSAATTTKSNDDPKKVTAEDEAAILAAIREDLDAEEKSNRANQNNDWDDAVIIDESAEDEKAKEEKEESEVEYEDFGLKQAKLRFKKQIDMNYISSLEPSKRKDAIEEAKRQQRLQSRREFIPAAANPDQFSSVQIQNFLKSSRFNLNVKEMAKAEVEKTNQHGGDLMASDRTTRISLIREDDVQKNKESDDDDDNDSVAIRDDPLFQKRPKKRQRLIHLGKDEDSSDEDAEIDWEDGARKNPEMSILRRRVIADDDSDGEADENTGQKPRARSNIHTDTELHDQSICGGFLPQTSPLASPVARLPARDKTEMGFLSDDFGGGGFLPTSSTRERESLTRGSEFESRPVKDLGSASGPGGGFLSETMMPNEKKVLLGVDKETAASGDKDKDIRKDAMVAQEMEDAMLAEAIQASQILNNRPTENGSTPKKTQFTLAIDDDSSDDDVPWEDGDAINQVAGAKSSGPPKESIINVRDSEDDEEEEIEREEGDQEAAKQRNIMTAEDSNESLIGGEAGVKSRRPLEENIIHVDSSDDKDNDESNVEWEDGEQDEAKKLNVTTETDSGMKRGKRKFTETAEALEVDDSSINNTEKNDTKDDDVGRFDEDIVKGTTASCYDTFETDTRESASKWKAQEEDWGLSSDMTSPSRTRDVSGQNGNSGSSSQPRSPNETAAAFARAQATAANLASWAGRAFRRAMKETGNESNRQGGNSSETAAVQIQKEKEVSYSAETIRDTVIANNHSAATPSPSNLKPSSDHHLQPTSQLDRHLTRATTAATLCEYEERWAKERNQRERDMDTITDEMKEEVMLLLRLFGVPYVEAPTEAEAQCAALEQLGLVNGIVTEDSDVFVFGGKKVYKNIFDEKLYAEAYISEDAEREMGLGRNAMIALAMLLGSDYTEGVKGVGIVNAMELLRAFDVSQDLKEGLKSFRTWLDGFDPADLGPQNDKDEDASPLKTFHAKHRTARSRWVAPEHFPADNVISAFVNPVVDKSPQNFSWGTPDIEGLVAFCSRYIGWREEETRQMLEPVVKKSVSRYRQTRLDSFMRYEDGIKFADVRSKRLREVLGLHGKNKELSDDEA